MMTKTKYGIMLMLLSATGLLTGCSNDDFNENGNANGNAITFDTNLQPFQSKASTFNSTTDMQTEGSFTCTTYEANSPTVSIPASRVVWSGIDFDWQFADDIHFWPTSGGLDFFAYMPAEKPTYISSISYGTARQPQFVCNLPSEQPNTVKEFICALATNQTKADNSDGVSMQFKHHFAKLMFKLDPASGSNVKINSVRIDGIKMSGTCTFDGETSTWTPSGDDTYVMATAIDGTTPYLVIPNTYAIGAVTITVNATWTSISGVTTNKTATNKAALTWQPGYSYLFTLTLSDNALVVNTSKWAEQM